MNNSLITQSNLISRTTQRVQHQSLVLGNQDMPFSFTRNTAYSHDFRNSISHFLRNDEKTDKSFKY